jgi:hypothetical protein
MSQTDLKIPRSQNQLLYDTCAFQKRLYESTAPLDYNLYQGKFENCKKHPCHEEPVLTKEKYVDVESELLNIDRPLTQCGQFKYSPDGKNSKITHKNAPKLLAPELCNIVNNNRPDVRIKNTGLNPMFSDNEPVVPTLNDYYNNYEKPPKILPNNDKTLNCEKHTKDINSGVDIVPSNSQ